MNTINGSAGNVPRDRTLEGKAPQGFVHAELERPHESINCFEATLSLHIQKLETVSNNAPGTESDMAERTPSQPGNSKIAQSLYQARIAVDHLTRRIESVTHALEI